MRCVRPERERTRRRPRRSSSPRRANDRGWRSPWSGPLRAQDANVLEARGRTSVRDGVRLAGLALSVVHRTVELPCRLAADHVAARPEFERVRLVGDVAKNARDLSLLHLVEHLTAE